MARAVLFILAVLMCAPARAAPDVDFGRYHALVIGINAYKNLPQLETAVNDASAVADVLRQKYGFEVTLLLNPGRSVVIRALDKLRGELTERDNLLIYYAGHGVLDVEADAGFWMSVDAEESTQADALVIGINAYKNLPQLETAVNDASAVADVLRQKYGFEVTLLLNPGRSVVIRALDKLRGELTERDNLLIYYAGHGVLDVEADAGFWMSVDAEESTQADWISIATITSTVRAMSAKHVMVVSDSCYSGRLTRGFSVSIKSGSERVAELRRLAGKRSRTALVSGGLEPVTDSGGEGHSVFTRAFLTALRESNEVLDGQQLFTAVRRPVIVNADQTPEYSDIRLAGHDGGDFLFVPVNLSVPTATDQQAPSPEAAPTASEPNLEVVFWESIRESKRAANFEAYLAQFPSGAFAALARNMLEEIKATESAAVAVEITEPSSAGGSPGAEVAAPLSGFDAREMELSVLGIDQGIARPGDHPIVHRAVPRRHLRRARPPPPRHPQRRPGGRPAGAVAYRVRRRVARPRQENARPHAMPN